jgi:CRP-like cAMP-binding protein
MNPELEQALKEHFQPLEIEKGHIFQAYGALNDNLYFLERGMLRRYIDEPNRRITLQFHLDDEFVITFKHMGGKIMGTGSGLEVLEDSLLWCIPGKIVDELKLQHLRFVTQLTEILVRGIIGMQNANICSHADGSSANYKNLCERFPRWLSRVPIEYLADFTNIPEKIFRHLHESSIKLYVSGERRRIPRR